MYLATCYKYTHSNLRHQPCIVIVIAIVDQLKCHDLFPRNFAPSHWPFQKKDGSSVMSWLLVLHLGTMRTWAHRYLGTSNPPVPTCTLHTAVPTGQNFAYCCRMNCGLRWTVRRCDQSSRFWLLRFPCWRVVPTCALCECRYM